MTGSDRIGRQRHRARTRGMRDVADEQQWQKTIAIDLDGTLAEYHGWAGGQIGAPIPAMVARVKLWLEDGKNIRKSPLRNISAFVLYGGFAHVIL